MIPDNCNTVKDTRKAPRFGVIFGRKGRHRTFFLEDDRRNVVNVHKRKRGAWGAKPPKNMTELYQNIRNC